MIYYVVLAELCSSGCLAIEQTGDDKVEDIGNPHGNKWRGQSADRKC